MGGPTYKQLPGHARISEAVSFAGVLAGILFSSCAPQVEGTQYLIEPKSRCLSSSKVYISTSSNLEALVLENLADAKETIIMQSDTVLPLSIIQGLQKAHARGVEIGVLFNSSFADTSDILKDTGIFIYLDTLNDLAKGDMAVIDGEAVLAGSFVSREGWIDSLFVIKNQHDPALYTTGWLNHTEHSLLIFNQLRHGPTEE